MEDPGALATVAELKLPFVMDDDEEREAQVALEELSDDARRYGRRTWTATSAPYEIKRLVCRAVQRHMKNYDGFIQSRAGDESVTWTDRGDDAGSAYFTEKEIQAIRLVAGHGGGLHTAQMSWGTTFAPDRKSSVGMVLDDAGVPFPYFPDDLGSPWVP